MQVQVSRSGGFAGIEEELASVDTAALGADQASDIERLVRDSGFFDMPAELPAHDVGADLFRYSITVTDDGTQHAVAYYDSGNGTSPATDQPQLVLTQLVEALIRLS